MSTNYISQQAKQCAEFAAFLVGPHRPCGRTYLLENANGKPCHSTGEVYFRTKDLRQRQIGLELNEENRKRIIVIERIQLQQSLRRKGFYTNLMMELQSIGFIAVIIADIENSSFANYLLRKARQSDQVTLLGNIENTKPYSINLASPSFAVFLN